MDKNTLKTISGLAQSTGINTSIKKGEYIQYKDQKGKGKIDKEITLRLHDVKHILDLDFETNTLESSNKYLWKDILISFNTSNGSGFVDLTIGLNTKIEDIFKIIKEKYPNTDIMVTNIMDKKILK